MPNKVGSSPTKPAYVLTSQEKSAFEKVIARQNAAMPVPRVKISGKEILIDHALPIAGEVLLIEALGAHDRTFMFGLLAQMANACSDEGQDKEGQLNFMISVVANIKPRDQVEAMLATQMACVHVLSMRFAKRLAICDNLPELDSHERGYSKLTRTFPVQMDALKRHRVGSDQTAASSQVVSQEADTKTGKSGALPSADMAENKVVPMKRKSAG